MDDSPIIGKKKDLSEEDGEERDQIQDFSPKLLAKDKRKQD